MVALFVSADENKDGLLSHPELVRHLHRVPWASALLRADLNWAEIWREYDADGDGMINCDEFLRLYKEKLQPLMKGRRCEARGAARPSPLEGLRWADSHSGPLQLP